MRFRFSKSLRRFKSKLLNILRVIKSELLNKDSIEVLVDYSGFGEFEAYLEEDEIGYRLIEYGEYTFTCSNGEEETSEYRKYKVYCSDEMLPTHIHFMITYSYHELIKVNVDNQEIYAVVPYYYIHNFDENEPEEQKEYTEEDKKPSEKTVITYRNLVEYSELPYSEKVRLPASK